MPAFQQYLGHMIPDVTGCSGDGDLHGKRDEGTSWEPWIFPGTGNGGERQSLTARKHRRRPK